MAESTNNNTANVSVGKGVAGGYFYAAPIGTPVPTDYSSTLNTAFKNIGFISDEGAQFGISSSTTDPYRDLNGDPVASSTPSKTETLTITFLETKASTLKEVYGQDNVTDANGVIHVQHTNDEMPARVLVLELVLKDGRRWRRCVPNAQVTNWDNQTLVYNDLVKYPVTYTLSVDDNGAMLHDYIQSTETASA